MCSLKGQVTDSTSRISFSPTTNMGSKNKLFRIKINLILTMKFPPYSLFPKLRVRIFMTFSSFFAISYPDSKDYANLKNILDALTQWAF